MHAPATLSQVRLTDIQAVEEVLDTLQHGNLESERGLSINNCVQIFRLLQLAIEYLSHLHASHAQLYEHYRAATEAAARWKDAARGYLSAGHALLGEVLEAGGYSSAALQRVEPCRQAVELADRQYNGALDGLEAADGAARVFRFRRQRAELNWQQLYSVNVHDVVGNRDVVTVQRLAPLVTGGNLLAESLAELTPHHFGQLVPLGQAVLDWTLHAANTSGASLQGAMAELQVLCSDIPPLTTAVQEMHDSIMAVLVPHQPPPPPLLPADGGSFTTPRRHIAGGGGGGGFFTPVSPQRSPHLFGGSASGAGGGRTAAATATLFGPGGGAMSTMAAVPPESMVATFAGHLKAAELSVAVGALEAELRSEKGRTGDLRRLLDDARNRLNMAAEQQQQQEEEELMWATSRSGGSALGRSPGGGPTRVQVYVDEDEIRGDERRRALQTLSRTVDKLKVQALMDRQAARNAFARAAGTPLGGGVVLAGVQRV